MGKRKNVPKPAAKKLPNKKRTKLKLGKFWREVKEIRKQYKK